MSLTGISNSGLFDTGSQSSQATPSALTAETAAKKLRQELQQLGQDLRSGNLSAAKADFAALQQNALQSSAATATGLSSTSIAQDFKQLTTDLQSGNITAAQTDYATIQHSAQSRAAQAGPGQALGLGQHHHRHGGGSSSASASGGNAISQLFAQLDTALQSGNLSAAQAAYTAFQQGAPQSNSTSTASTSAGVSIDA